MERAWKGGRSRKEKDVYENWARERGEGQGAAEEPQPQRGKRSDPRLPSTPRGLHAVPDQEGQESVTLQWASGNQAGSAAAGAGFELQYREVQGGPGPRRRWSKVPSVIRANVCRKRNLKAGAVYEPHATALHCAALHCTALRNDPVHNTHSAS